MRLCGSFSGFANPEDEFFLVEFNSRAHLTVPLTSDSGDIQNRLLVAQPKGKTALLDAVCLAIDSLKHARYARRALLVLSDGGDNNSRFPETEVRNRVRESDVWIYTMGIYDQPKPAHSKRRNRGRNYWKRWPGTAAAGISRWTP